MIATRYCIEEGDIRFGTEIRVDGGMGDVLYGLFPDEDADSVSEVREIRRP